MLQTRTKSDRSDYGPLDPEKAHFYRFRIRFQPTFSFPAVIIITNNKTAVLYLFLFCYLTIFSFQIYQQQKLYAKENLGSGSDPVSSFQCLGSGSRCLKYDLKCYGKSKNYFNFKTLLYLSIDFF